MTTVFALPVGKRFSIPFYATCAFAVSVLFLFHPSPIRSRDSGNDVDFDRQVAPLLAARCLSCHSGARPKGGLDLSRKKSAFAGGDSGPVIMPGDFKRSLLWRHVVNGKMPPKKPLGETEKKLLAQWIVSGAKWGKDPIDPFRFTTGKRAGYDWWSLQPVKRPLVPAVKGKSRIRTPIDNFVLSRLEQNGLSFSADAAPRVLIRRLYYDLIGLPPAPDEVAAFLKESNVKPQAAFEKVVDRLLDSPHYGERWGRHWLDVVRFGESNGFERNDPRKNFWPYRDWVIRAFNADMPYDRFVRMQIAGDVLNGGDREGLEAVGFLVAGVHNTVVGGSDRMKKLARQDELEEIVGTLGQTFVGLTFNCARCHDHKFDPIRHEEYYRLTAALSGVYHGERAGRSGDIVKRLKTVETATASLEKAREAIDAPVRRAIRKARKEGKDAGPKPPQPFARWEFDTNFKDSIGILHGKVVNNARLAGGALIVDGSSYVETAALTKDLAEKTLEAWVLLDDLNQRGGAAISVQSRDGRFFDAIVFGEREPKRWMAGSDNFRRTQSFRGPEEKDANGNPVHFAIVYKSDGRITGYRNGKLYGRAYASGGLQRFKAGDAQIVFGLRHSPPGGNRMLRGKILRAQLYDRALPAAAIAASAGIGSDYVAEKEIISKLSPGQRNKRAQIVAQLKRWQNSARELHQKKQQKVYTVTPRSPGDTHVLTRGDVMKLGNKVTPGAVAAVAGLNAEFELPANASDTQRRLKLAHWITNTNNPLFTRVIVNRIWHYHFGRGIVQTPNDFGFNGGRPSHPELLDWLASKLKDNQFKLKELHRLIVTSTVYRQTSAPVKKALAIDAANRLLWRKSPVRVEAEVLRDSILKVAGQLNLKRGGPGFVDVKIRPLNGTTYYTPFDSDDVELQRRTVYRFSPRGGRSALLDTFDCPDPSATAPRRTVTTTPLQALSLLNNAFVLRMSDRFAERIRKDCGLDVGKQIDGAFLLAFGRGPERRERILAARLVRDHGLPALCRALFNSNEFVVID